jgi:uncharacterized tellurite resistance protein B-like protein
MLRQFSELFSQFTPKAIAEDPLGRGHTLQLATAVLLIEVVRADTEHCAVEQAALKSVLQARFALTAEETERLIELAQLRSTEAHDLHSFTSLLNETLSETERQEIFESLWRVAYADGRLDAHENHLMRRLADLLHIRHAAFVGTKMRAASDIKISDS